MEEIGAHSCSVLRSVFCTFYHPVKMSRKKVYGFINFLLYCKGDSSKKGEKRRHKQSIKVSYEKRLLSITMPLVLLESFF